MSTNESNDMESIDKKFTQTNQDEIKNESNDKERSLGSKIGKRKNWTKKCDLWTQEDRMSIVNLICIYLSKAQAK